MFNLDLTGLVDYVLLGLLLLVLVMLFVLSRMLASMNAALKGKARQIHDIESALMDLQGPLLKQRSELEQIKDQLAKAQELFAGQSQAVLEQGRSVLQEAQSLFRTLREDPRAALKDAAQAPAERAFPTVAATMPTHGPYVHAIELIQQGYGADVLMEQCGISRGEADLLLAMHKARPQSP